MSSSPSLSISENQHAISRELDQVMSYYREKLRDITSLWAQMTQLGLCDISMSKGTEDIVRRLEMSVATVMEKEVKVERARQAVLNIGLVLDVSRQTVEAKSQHLGQEERQKEEAQSIRFKEFQKIHKLQAEKAAIEKDLVPASARLDQVTETLHEKNEKIRNLENFHESLAEHCATDMLILKDRTDIARSQRGQWDMQSIDICNELKAFGIDKAELQRLNENVCSLKQALQNHRQWHEEELQTKLFLSTRSKEMKRRLTYYRTLLRRLEHSGRSEDGEGDPDDKLGLERRSDNFLVDGSPGVHAKEVEQFLSHQFGMRVLADYTMLKRLKEEIGVHGLAYLVEKIRLQGAGHVAPNTACTHSYSDWEEKRVQQALLNIALEYREQDENKRMLRVPGLSLTSSSASMSADDRDKHSPLRRGCGHADRADSASVDSGSSQTTGHLTNSSQLSGSSSRPSSTMSLKRKSSMAKLKKLLHF